MRKLLMIILNLISSIRPSLCTIIITSFDDGYDDEIFRDTSNGVPKVILTYH